ncbi:MAG TPA: DUF4402 domain-containing protein [Thermoanaerobaculia bacterium]|nr:DUF4402 domain-containing protein [Thermoanaerobaculia bacterium]
MKSLLVAAVSVLLAAGGRADAATATASIGVTILGTGGADPAASAVTLSARRPFADDGHGRVAGSFSVAGARRAAYAVVVPSEVRAMGPHGDLVMRPADAGARSLPESGRHETALDLRAEGSAAPGRYAGTFPVTVAYN